jgi:conjugal transfer pilin signal peptidase TrbI
MPAFFIKHPLARRFQADALPERRFAHARHWALTCLLLAVATVLFQTYFTVGINRSSSLPHRLYLIQKGTMPTKGEFVAFRWNGGGPYAAGAIFVKILAGVPGDRVTRMGPAFFVNGQAVGTAKPLSSTGVPLEAGATGVLPPDQYYVRATHPDSLDSRYALTGWILRDQIVGRAHALF